MKTYLDLALATCPGVLESNSHSKDWSSLSKVGLFPLSNKSLSIPANIEDNERGDYGGCGRMCGRMTGVLGKYRTGESTYPQPSFAKCCLNCSVIHPPSMWPCILERLSAKPNEEGEQD